MASRRPGITLIVVLSLLFVLALLLIALASLHLFTNSMLLASVDLFTNSIPLALRDLFLNSILLASLFPLVMDFRCLFTLDLLLKFFGASSRVIFLGNN